MQRGMRTYSHCYAIMILIIIFCTSCSCRKFVSDSDNTDSSLKQSKLCPKGVPATLNNLTGLDGCSWVLILENGQKLEPTNLNNFDNIKLEEGKKVFVEYEVKPNMASICMVGKIAEIKCISEE